MTTYILHGGKIKVDSESNRLLFKQFTSLVLKDNVHIIMCYFAEEKSKGEQSFERDRGHILAHAVKKTEIYKVNSVESLREELEDADVLYMSGGEEAFLRPYIPQLTFLKEMLQNKIYIGSSMGAFLASKHYILSFENKVGHIVREGLGLVPYNVLFHWNIEAKKDKKIAMLKEKDPTTPILCIEEQKFEKIIIQ